MLRVVMTATTTAGDKEQLLLRMSQLHAALSQINQAIVRVRTREQLFADVCESLVAFGKFKMAWVGWNDPSRHTVSVASRYGDIDGYLDSVAARGDDSPEGTGPVDQAIREGASRVLNDLSQLADTQPWHAAAARCGFNAIAAFPLRMDGHVCGALAVYSARRGFFAGPEIELLDKAAADISFALDHLQGESLRRQAEAAMQRQNELYQLVQRATNDAIWDWDLASGTLDWNETIRTIFGHHDVQSPSGIRWWQDHIHPDDRERVMAGVMGVLREGGAWTDEYRFRKGDGSFSYVLNRGCVVLDDCGKPLRMIGAMADLTDRKVGEQTRAALHQISEAAQSASTLPDLFHSIHEIVGQLLPARNFFVALHDARKDQLTFPYYVDEHDTAPEPQKLDDGTLSGRVIQLGQSLLLTPDTPRVGIHQELEIIGTGSMDWLGVPLKSQSRTIGALVVQSYSGDVRYTDKDKALLEFVSGQVAAA
ncbi:MAG: sensor protein, partial [Xanthomonadaceae bacterium]|nr:sensor protein [Xanthomonadaceae bacterium]